jgi:RNA polymerase sigma factor (sigma-70 family)
MSNALRKRSTITEARRRSNLVSFPKNKALEVSETNSTYEQRRKERLVLDYRERGRKLARSILRGWRAIYDLKEIDSIVDLSLCEAVQRFDTKRSVSFLTFFYYHLKGNLIKNISDSASAAKHMPVYDSSTYDQADLHLKARLLSAQDVADALNGQEDTSPDQELLKKEMVRLRISACAKLSELERIVIERVLFNEEGVNELANELGYSRCHISRVKGKALEALKREFEDYFCS